MYFFNRTHVDNRIIVYAVYNLSEVTILYKYSSNNKIIIINNK